ncbi:type II secretion system protein XpsI [Marilutibacter aestuarii]|uniref:General secretion pathway protein GspI n=1 Tax=Marilutibacter aestuarii TaxID=1706195 RepID=A0A507ZTR4_9GAMM|nr:prepilin-type N-terminal cleavage/methylation domain-containing protein [Lysobacter aestuarii]TQD39961.1 general secretion pathway protein GspI [Lysobacter aestuarii]
MSRALRRPPHRQGGYTLIEVIVAFALLALALGLLLGTLSGATRQVRWSGDAGRAALHAQSLIDQMGIAAPIRAGRDDGDFEDGRYRWTMEITPWEDPDVPPDAPPSNNTGNRLYEIALAVEWGEGGSGEHLRLRTLRLVQGGLEDVP